MEENAGRDDLTSALHQRIQQEARQAVVDVLHALVELGSIDEQGREHARDYLLELWEQRDRTQSGGC